MPTKGYATVSDVVDILGWNAEDSLLADRITSVLEYCENAVDDFCGTEFDFQEDTIRLYDGSGVDSLVLGFFLRTLTSVYVLDINGDRAYQLTDVVAGPTPLRSNRAYRFIKRRQSYNSSGELTISNIFPPGLANIEVTGDWGWDTDEYPRELTRAVAYAVKYLFDLGIHNDLIDMESGLGRTVMYKTNRGGIRERVEPLPDISRRILAGYKNQLEDF